MRVFGHIPIIKNVIEQRYMVFGFLAAAILLALVVDHVRESLPKLLQAREAAGRALVAQVGADDFLVAGYSCRVDFHPSDPSSKAQREFIRVEEGTYDGGVFRPARIWNGDQTDWGLDFGSVPVVLRARIGTF